MLKWIGAIVLIVGGFTPQRTQTVDESRPTVGLSVGSLSGAQIWSIAHQPIVSATTGQGFMPAAKTVVTRFTSIAAGFEIRPY